MEDKVVKAGKTLTWDLKFAGEPEPTVEWQKITGLNEDETSTTLVPDSNAR